MRCWTCWTASSSTCSRCVVVGGGGGVLCVGVGVLGRCWVGKQQFMHGSDVHWGVVCVLDGGSGVAVREGGAHAGRSRKVCS